MTPISCSFCGKSDEEAFALVAGPTCSICDACVDLAFDVVAAKREATDRPWVERAARALGDLYQSRGDAALDAKLREVFAESGADERLLPAGEAARRMIAELREIDQAFAAAVLHEKRKGTR